MKVKVIQGDITKLDTDAIVNAANKTLLGGGGVDGAIHRAAGPQLKEYCSRLGGCETGEAKITPGFSLPAGHVIHTVGPVWNENKEDEMDELLASCYYQSLLLAKENSLKSIAFPSISTGVYNFPLERACKIALKAVINFGRDNNLPEEVTFVMFSKEDFQTMQKTHDQLIK